MNPVHVRQSRPAPFFLHLHMSNNTVGHWPSDQCNNPLAWLRTEYVFTLYCYNLTTVIQYVLTCAV